MALLLALAWAGCGYRPLLRPGTHGRLRVGPSMALVADGAGDMLAEELASGARAELARVGALGVDDARDVLRLELVRLDDLAEGVALADGRPRARGLRVRVWARGSVSPATSGAGATPWETPDVEASELVAASTEPAAWDASRRAAARSAARKAGASVAREALGLP